MDTNQLSELIGQIMDAAGNNMWVVFAGLVMLVVAELSARVGLLNWLPEQARGPVAIAIEILKALGGALKKRKPDGDK